MLWRGSSAPFDLDRGQDLLDGMLDAAIKVVRDETDAKLSEKDRKIRQLRDDHKKSEAELERLRSEDAKRLEQGSARHETILREGIDYANKWIGRYQFLGSVLVLAAGALASFGVFCYPDKLPTAVDLGSKLVALVGIFFTVQALRGRPVPGLWQIIERRGEKWYADYCINKGVSAIEAQERLTVGNGHLLLAEQKKHALGANDMDE